MYPSASAILPDTPKAGLAPTLAVGFMPMPPSFSHRAALLHGRPRHEKYDDFWLRHPPMDRGRHAKLFSAFDALRGFDACILSKETIYTERRDLSEEEKEVLNKKIIRLHSLTRNSKMARRNRPFVKITYFEPCTDPYHFSYGSQGQYKTIEGIVCRVDPVVSKSIRIGSREIPLADIADICYASWQETFPASCGETF